MEARFAQHLRYHQLKALICSQRCPGRKSRLGRFAPSQDWVKLRSVLLLGLVARAAAVGGVLPLRRGILGPPVAAKVGEEGAAAVVSGGGNLASGPMLGVTGGHP